MRERRSVPMPRLAVKDQPYPDEEDHSDAEQAEQDKSGWATVRQIRPGGGSQTGRTASSDIVVVAILLLGIYAFAVVTGFEERWLTRRTTRRAEDLYDDYIDPPAAPVATAGETQNSPEERAESFGDRPAGGRRRYLSGRPGERPAARG